MILALLGSIVFATIFVVREKTSIFVVFYLSLLPLVIFSGQPIFSLLLSLLLGYLLYLLFRSPSTKTLLVFVGILIVSVLIYHPRPGLDLGSLNAINAQRGEHPDFQNSFVSRLIHNKAELSHSFVRNFDRLLSPAAIFASGYWHKTNAYYPLGYLFPWDIYFIYIFFKERKDTKGKKTNYQFILGLTSLLLFCGLSYVDDAMIYGFSVVYFLALLAAKGYAVSTKRTQKIFLTIICLYLLYHLQVSKYFYL